MHHGMACMLWFKFNHWFMYIFPKQVIFFKPVHFLKPDNFLEVVFLINCVKGVYEEFQNSFPS